MNLYFNDYGSPLSKREAETFNKKTWQAYGYRSLEALCLFCGCPGLQPMDDLKEYFHYRIYSKGTMLAFKGKPCDKLYFILWGGVKITLTNDDGSENVAGLFNEGNMITSIESFFNNGLSLTDISATSKIRVMEITKDDFTVLMKKNSCIEQVTQAIISMRLNHQLKFSNMFYLPAQERVRKLKENFPQLFDSFLDKDIASLVGLTKETFSRQKKAEGL